MYLHKVFPLLGQLILTCMAVLHSIVVALVQATPIEINDRFSWVRIDVVAVTLVFIIVFINMSLELLSRGRSFRLI